jgi:hypothetical protein
MILTTLNELLASITSGDKEELQLVSWDAVESAIYALAALPDKTCVISTT